MKAKVIRCQHPRVETGMEGMILEEAEDGITVYIPKALSLGNNEHDPVVVFLNNGEYERIEEMPA